MEHEIINVADLPEGFILDFVISIGFILFISVGTYLLSKKTSSIPYAVLLVIVGLILGQLEVGFLSAISLTPELLLFIFLPILLYESASEFNFRQFREVSIFALSLASVGLVITAAIVAVPFHYIIGVGWLDSILFGIIISSTDPVAVLSIFKKVGVAKRLSLIVDGESILNDGVSIILFKIIAAILVGGSLATRDLVSSAALSIPFAFVSSILIGSLLGFIFARLISSIKNDKSAEILLTVILANVTFIIGDHIHITYLNQELSASGVISVLAAGLVMGNYGRTKISPEVRKSMHDIWEMLGFVSISIVFFLVGLRMNVDSFLGEMYNIITLSIVLIFGRSVAVYLLGALNNVFSRQKVPVAWLHIINWGGLRGALPLVVVLILPETYAFKDVFLTIILGIVFFSLILNATTIPSVIRMVGEGQKGIDHLVESEITRLLVLRALDDKIAQLWARDEIDKQVYEQELKKVKKMMRDSKHKFSFWLSTKTPQEYNIEAEKILRKYCFAIEKSVYKSLHTKGVINEGVFSELTNGIDLQIDLVGAGSDPYSERKKLDYGHYYNTLPAYLYQHPLIGKMLGIDRNRDLKFEYMFHKARELGNEDVLDELKRFKKDKLFPNTKILEQLTQTYKKHFKSNKTKAQEFGSQDLEFVRSLQHKFSERECIYLEKELIDRLGENDMLKGVELGDLKVIFAT